MLSRDVSPVTQCVVVNSPEAFRLNEDIHFYNFTLCKCRHICRLYNSRRLKEIKQNLFPEIQFWSSVGLSDAP